VKTRFAPSPTGLLHLGNIYSALQCESWAKEHDAELSLRIEDIDFTRCKPEFTQQIIEDLRWVGITFDDKVVFQSERHHFYQAALDKLIAMDVLYPCFCTRKQIKKNIKKSNVAQLDDYPKTCLSLNAKQAKRRMQDEAFSWRLDSTKVEGLLGKELSWSGSKSHLFNVSMVGDVIIGRKDIGFSYHLAVVVDDEVQKITHIIRGEDLRSSTPVHRILQLLLGYHEPKYIHHKLLNETGDMKLSKGNQSLSLKSLRDQGLSVEAIKQIIKKTNLS